MSEFWSTFPVIREGLDRIRVLLRRQAEFLPADLRSEFSPLVRSEGKSLRAGLILLSAGSQSQERRGAVEAAAVAVELLHLASLVHDDIVDQAALRRGVPAFHVKLGAPKAVLYGDLLFAACFRSVSRDVGPESARALADLVAVMAASEIQQLNDRFQLPIDPRRILRKTMGKTALLFSLSLYVGAHEGGRSVETCRWFRRAGYSLGMAFQLQDDLLDWTGDPGLLGKPILEDLSSGIYTWPVALAWRVDPAGTEQDLGLVRDGKMSPAALWKKWEGKSCWLETEVLVTRYVDRASRDLDRALGLDSRERQDWNRFMEQLLRRKK